MLTVLLPALLAIASPQAVVTGTWSGAVVFKIAGEEKAAPLHAVLKQNGDTLTGTAGPDADRQFRILKGTATAARDGVTIGFELIVDGEHAAFELKLVDGLLRGKATLEGEDGRPHGAAVELKPVKNPAMRE